MLIMNIVDVKRKEKKEKKINRYKKKVANNQQNTFNLTSRTPESGGGERFVEGKRAVINFVSDLKSVACFYFH